MKQYILKQPSLQVDKSFASGKLGYNSEYDGGSSRDIMSEFRRENRFGALHPKRRSHRQVSKFESDEETVKEEKRTFKQSLQKMFEETFVKNLVDRSYIKRIGQLSHYQISVLDDLQFGTDKEVDDINNLIYRIFSKYLDKWNVIQPQSNFKITWNIIVMLTLFSIFIWLPYKMSFEINYIQQLFGGDQMVYLEIVLFGILVLDVFMSLNESFISKGIIINQRYYIMTNYFKNLATQDLLCLGTMLYQLILIHQQESPFEQDYIQLQIVFCLIFCVLKSFQIDKIFTQIQEYYNLKGILKEVVLISKIFIGIFYLIHLVACIWYGLGTIANEITWVDLADLRSASNGIKYANCLHWSAVYLTSVGSTTIVESNAQELVFSTFVSFLSLIVCGIVVVTIGFFIHKLQQNNLAVKSLKIMNNFMSMNKIDFNLQVRIRNYLDYICKEEQSMIDEDVSMIMCKLSQTLQNELKHELRASILDSCTLISSNFSGKLRNALVNYMEEISTTPEERIITMNEIDDSSIYIINKGEVEIVHEGRNKMGEIYKRNQIKIQQKGDFFGIFGFITGNARTATVLSKGFCRLFKITRSNFMNVLDQYPDDKEIFHMIKDQVNINEDYSELNIRCYACKSIKHMVNTCPTLHFSPDIDRVIKQQFYPHDQERDDPYQPRKSKFINALLQQQIISQIARDFQLAEQDEIDEETGILIQEDESSGNGTKTYSQMQSRSISRSLSQFSKRTPQSPSQSQQLQQQPLQGNQTSLARHQVELQNFEAEMEARRQQYERKKIQKNTVETAGFGGGAGAGKFKGNDKDDSGLFVEEFDSEESEEEEDDDQQQEDDEVDSGSEDSQNLMIKNTDNSVKSNMQQSKIPNQKVTFQQEEYGSGRNDFLRNSLKRKSTRTTNTAVVFEKVLASLQDNTNNVIEIPIITQPSVGDFDKMFHFRKFYPHYNFKRVIKMIRKFQLNSKHVQPFSLYTFFISGMEKGLMLRKKAESLKNMNKASVYVKKQQNQPQKIVRYNKIFLLGSKHLDLILCFELSCFYLYSQSFYYCSFICIFMSKQQQRRPKEHKVVQTNLEEDPPEFYLPEQQEPATGHILEQLRITKMTTMKKYKNNKKHGNTTESVPIKIKSHLKTSTGVYFELEFHEANLLNSYYPQWFLRERFPKLLLEYYKHNSILILQ